MIHLKLLTAFRSSVIDYIRSRRVYWKYRHIFEPSVWQVYQQSSTFNKCRYFSDFVVEHGVTSVFEFGCASAPNLINIATNVESDVELIGYDINSAAIELAQTTLPRATFFSDKSKLLQFLADRNPPCIDLVIFDRVLYLLSNHEVLTIISLLRGKVRYIVIDDFHSDRPYENINSPYLLRNYIKLFDDYSCLKIEDTQHSTNNDYALCCAKRIVLESKSYSS